MNGATIYTAYSNEAWPGKAAVVTSRIHLFKGMWKGRRSLSKNEVTHISAFLSSQEEWTPRSLSANANLAYLGSYVLGMGFVLAPEDAKKMLLDDPRNADVVFPYVNGDDLNSEPDQQATRFVINFWDWLEETAKTYSQPYQHLVANVYSERLEKSKQNSYRNIMSSWWLHWNARPGLYHAIGRGSVFRQHPTSWSPEQQTLRTCLVVARVSKTLAFALVDSKSVFSDQVVVFGLDSTAYFALLQSNIHGVFAWQFSSKLKNDLRYSLTDAFEPFPMPDASRLTLDSRLARLGLSYHTLRAELMRDESIGLTKVYRRFHDSNDSDSRLVRLRDLHRQMDVDVAHAYGWDDLDLNHGFHEVPYLPKNDRVRFTISESARVEVLRRLSELNRQRYEEEVARGLHESKATGSVTRAPRNMRTGHGASSQPSFDFDAIPANEGNYLKASEQRAFYQAGPTHTIVEYLKAHTGWHAKSDIVVATGITDGQWNAAIAELIADNRIERQGEKRGARYRVVTERAKE